MRNLTVKRNKSFVACVYSSKLYLEDPISGDLVINGVNCRKIGELRNGEENTYIIPGNAAKLFVIADKISKNYCSDVYDLPEGSDDIYLTGQHRYNPATGNAFRFDGNVSEEAIRSRKKGTRIGIVVLIISFAIGIGLGILRNTDVFRGEPQEKVFRCDNLSVTLTDAFEKRPDDDADLLLIADTPETVLFIYSEEINNYENYGIYTATDYASTKLSSNELDSDIRFCDGIPYYTYSYYNEEDDVDFTYYDFLYKNGGTFWSLTFCCNTVNAAEYEPLLFNWAKTVTFDTTL